MEKQTLDTAHRQWASRPADERFQTLDSLMESVSSRRNRSKSLDVDTVRTEIKEDDKGVLTVNGTITPCERSHWAFSQLATNIGAPASYLRTFCPMIW